MARTKTVLRFPTVVVLVAVVLVLLSACSASTDQPDSASSGDNVGAGTNTVTNSELDSGESSQQANAVDNSTTEANAAQNTTATTPASVPVDDSALSQLLFTDYTVVDNQIVPTTSWICTDVFNQNRALYFFAEGVLDASRRVSIERTLYSNNTFDDIAFFWSVSASDAIVMNSATFSEATGGMLSTGQSYDVTGFRFFEVESRLSFTADSVLRGQLTCALFDIQ